MKAIIYRTCEVNKWGENYSICELQYVNNKYVVIILEDSDNLFVDFNLEIDNNESSDIVIKYFEDECLNRFTCYGDFSLEEVKENSGEEILFY
jgi:hypothetical protein